MAKKPKVRPTGPNSSAAPHFGNAKRHNTLADVSLRLSTGFAASGMSLGMFSSSSFYSEPWEAPKDPTAEFREKIVEALERDYKENSPLHRRRALKKKP